MKKVGLLTYHGAINYGSVLQAYALQQTIINLGNQCEIIDFRPKKQSDIYAIFRKPNSIKNILIDMWAMADYGFMKRRNDDFESFLNNRLKLSESKLLTNDGIEKIEGNYDVFCAGSDQIWNLSAPDYDEIYFMNFTNKRKISYAASMGGVSNIDYWKSSAKEQLKDLDLVDSLDCISVREKSAVPLLENYTNKDIKVVLDPTLLMNKSQWEKIISNNRIKGKYIFLYSIGYNEDVYKLGKKLSEMYNLPMVTLYTLRTNYKYFAKGVKRAKNEAPEDFLRLINDAEYVVTNSFHGTAFSINFQKEFWVAARHDDKGNVVVDERLENILTKTELLDRVIDVKSDEKVDFSSKIDYKKVNKYLNPLVEDSIDFLKKGID